MTQLTTIVMVGVSGVGKSRLAQAIVSRVPSVRHVQASQLLKEALQAQSEELRLGPVRDNQAVLIDAFNKLRSSTEEVILLDAHCVIDTPDGIVVIPEEVFYSFHPTAFIEVWEEPGLIVSRRAADLTRVRPKRDEDDIREHQRLSGEKANQYAAQFRVQITRVKSGDEEGAIAAVTQSMSSE